MTSLSGWCSRRSAHTVQARPGAGVNRGLVDAGARVCWSPTPTDGCTGPTPFPEKCWGPGRSPAAVTRASLGESVSVCRYSGPMRPCGPQRRGTTTAATQTRSLPTTKTDRPTLAKGCRSASAHKRIGDYRMRHYTQPYPTLPTNTPGGGR